MRPNRYTRCARHGTFTAMALAISLGAFAQRAQKSSGHDAAADELLHNFEKRITFTENQGQFSEGVLYRADFPLGQALATPEGMYMKSYDPIAVRERQEEGMRIEQDMHDGKPSRPLTWRERGHGWMMSFKNATSAMRVESRAPHTETTNYFIGGKSALNVGTSNEVWYTNVYAHTDIRYYPDANGALEYDIICKPGSDPRNIAIEFKGIEQLRVNEKGELVMPTSLGELTYPAPVVYQRVNGRERKVEASYTVSKNNILGFTLGDYDKSQPLVIDPIALRWATWVNTASSDDNHGHAIWVDPSDGAIYVVARVVGTTDQITVGAFDVMANGNLEMIVGKYVEPAVVGGSGTRVWQTYIGGNNDDNPYAMEQGPDGNLYITGLTGSTNFPLLGGTGFTGASLDQQAQSGNDIFVLKINTAGTGIKSCVIGGNGDDLSYDLRTTSNGDVLVCGTTTSTNLNTLNGGTASNTNNGGTDVILFKVNQALSSLVWMRNYGGSGGDETRIMVQDPVSNEIFLGGYTASTNFPTVSPRQSTRGGNTAGFLQRLNSIGAASWSSYFSSAASSSAQILCMEFNTTRTELYFGGLTTGLLAANISANGVLDNSYNGSTDYFVCRMGIDQSFLASTYLGGTGTEANMMGLNTDLNNDVYVFGYSASTNFPTSSLPNTALQTTNQGENDKTFSKLSANLGSLLFSTYYGGTTDDYDPVGERGIKFSNCRIYTIVTAESNNIPLTQGALNTTKVSSSTTIYEPGLVVWANPPDILDNTINGNQTICAGGLPGNITGSNPSYVLPTIVRNNSASAYPSLGSAATFQWQISTDSLNWTNILGATSQNLLGSQVGVVTIKTFIRRIIGGDACVLAGAADQVVTVNINTVTGVVNDALCNAGSNGSITATSTGTGPFTYLWSNGQTTQTATNLAAGPYSVTVTDMNQCPASGNFQVGQPSAVGGSAQVTSATCGNNNGSATASGSGGTPGYSYLWSTGAVGSVLSGVAGGNYSVTITDANQCAFVLPVSISGGDVPNANAGAESQITCLNNQQVVLDGSSTTPNVTFSWSGPGIVSGGGTEDVTVNVAGTYTLTVTNVQTGCTASDAAVVTANTTLPGAQATGGTLNCNVSSVQLGGSGNGTFSWSGPNNYTSNVQNPTVSVAGTYVLTVTGANGCTSTAQAVVEQDNTLPGAQATGGTLNCTVLSVQLGGSGNGTFSWSGPNNYTSNVQNPTVSVAGTYVLTVTGANGCTSTAQAVVELDGTLPGAQATGGTLNCTVLSVQLGGSGNGTFSWSGPNNYTSNVQNPTVSVAGTYVLTVTGANGCTSTAQAVVEQDSTLPGAQATGGTLNCTVLSVQLGGSGNGTFSWSGPNNYTSNVQNPTVSVAGTYVLTVTGANGCTSTAQAVVEQDSTLPGAQATGGTLNCTVLSVQLGGSGNGTFSWSGPNNYTSNVQNPTVSVAGTYVLTVTGANGCTSTAQAVVELDGTLPGAQATGGTLNCTVLSVQLGGSGNGTFSWSGPNNYTSNVQNPTVSVAGTYVLTVTGANGCTSTAQAVVEQDNTPPGAQATGGVVNCTVLSLQLGGSGNGTFSWSGPNNYTSNLQNPTVSDAGTYVLTVTGANGCTSTAEAQVEQDSTLPGAQATGGNLTCSNVSVQLGGSGNGTFSWSGPNGFTSTQQNPVVGTAGTYVLTVTGSNGCSSTAQAIVEQDDSTPGAQAIGGVLNCSISSIQLSGSGNGTYSWSGPNNFTSNVQNPTVSVAGTYVLTVTGANGCTSVAQAVVEQDNTLPGAQATGGVLNCNVSSVQLGGSGNGSFSWSGPNNYTSNVQNPTVSVAGTYVLTVTGANGCTSQASAVVESDLLAPDAFIGFFPELDCNIQSVALTGNSPQQGVSFSWSGPNGFTSADQTINVSTIGTYVLTVTGENGCSSNTQATVTRNGTLPGAQATGGVLTCENNAVILGGFGNGSYSWTGPNGFTSLDQTPVVTVAGTYVLTVTGANGCTSTASTEVTLDADVPTAGAQGGVLNCNVSSVTLQGSGNGTFSWSGPNNFTSAQQNPVVTLAGTYVLTVTGANGCISVAQAEVTSDTNVPEVFIGFFVQLDCNNQSTTLTGNSTTVDATFSWTGPNGFTSMNQSINVSAIGTYVFTATGPNGCSATTQATVTQDGTLPNAIATGGSLTCSIASVQLNAIAGGTFVWSGPNNFTSTEQSPVVTVAGTYVLTVTGSNGCINTASALVTQENTGLELSTQGGTVPCDGSGALISASADGEVIYTWSGPNNFSATGAQVLVFVEGIYTVTGVNDNGCSATAEVTVNKANCDDCAPIIIECPQPQTVECGTDLDPDVIGYPVYRKDPNCPAINYSTYYDITAGYCPRTVTRYWTMADETGDTAYCLQVFIFNDTQAPELLNVPADVTVECGQVPEKSGDVWAEDNCKDWLDVQVTDAVDEDKNKCSYTITRTYWAVDACGNLGTATQVITVVDNTPPTIACEYELDAELKADCKDVPKPVECKAEDNCDSDVQVDVHDVYAYDVENKQCILLRTYSATDDCGNTTSIEQTILLIGDCCEKEGAGKVMEVSVSPNPFRDECVIAFKATKTAKAVLNIIDMNGRPVAEAFNATVTKGQEVRVRFTADQVQRGIYQYSLLIGNEVVTGRLIVQ